MRARRRAHRGASRVGAITSLHARAIDRDRSREDAHASRSIDRARACQRVSRGDRDDVTRDACARVA